MELPAFLRRQPERTKPMTTPTPAKKPKQKRSDAYVARLTVTIPLDMTKPECVADALKAIAAIGKSLPAGATFKSEGALARV
jgi:hypothetical protein